LEGQFLDSVVHLGIFLSGMTLLYQESGKSQPIPD
jgi:glucan phosphorylase